MKKTTKKIVNKKDLEINPELEALEVIVKECDVIDISEVEVEATETTRECLCGELIELTGEVVVCKCGRKHF